MKPTEPDLSSDLRVSPGPLFVALPVLGMIFYGLGEFWVDAGELSAYVGFALLMYAFSGLGWLLMRWKPQLASWYALSISMLAVFLAEFWLKLPGALVLAAVPPVLAIAQINFKTGLAAAVLETAALLGLYRFGWVGLASTSLPLIEIWAVFGAVAAVHLPARDRTRWSWNYFLEARSLLEEARNRQGELSRALGDLAHANRQLTRLNSLAQSLRQAAEDARLAKEQFVANVSHELRTPLNMIIGFSEMILDAPETYGESIPTALLADLSIVRRNAEHLSELIDDVLDLSQIEADQMALTREFVPFSEIVESATGAVRPLFNSKHLFLRVEMPEDLQPVFVDRTRIREVLLNLLSNAGRFTESGGVQVRAWEENGSLVVSVNDTGPGISPENINKLFQPFQQIDGSIRRRYGGTGLGLNISKRFIELHGGKIWVESQHGIGTTFYFLLPVAPQRPAGASVTRWIVPEWDFVHRVPEPGGTSEKVRPRLVVAERGNAVGRLLTRYFGDAEVVAVDTLEAALSEIAVTPSQMLLVNDPAGADLLHRLDPAALPYEIPVISCSVPGTEEMATNLGADGYLVKPISKETLLAALEQIPLPNKTILIVDDEPEALRLFHRMLHASGKGYSVLRARDGQEALRVLRQYRPDVILMDLVMPNLDGYQLLRMRSEDADLRQIPIIITSARDPFGQPIVTHSLSITRKGGISIHALMSCVQAVSQILAMPGQPGGPGLTPTPPGELVY